MWDNKPAPKGKSKLGTIKEDRVPLSLFSARRRLVLCPSPERVTRLNAHHTHHTPQSH